VTNSEYDAWRAQIELCTSLDALDDMAKDLSRLPREWCRSRLLGAVHGRQKQLEWEYTNRPQFDPWNDPVFIGGHLMPPLSHRYRR